MWNAWATLWIQCNLWECLSWIQLPLPSGIYGQTRSDSSMRTGKALQWLTNPNSKWITLPTPILTLRKSSNPLTFSFFRSMWMSCVRANSTASTTLNVSMANVSVKMASKQWAPSVKMWTNALRILAAHFPCAATLQEDLLAHAKAVTLGHLLGFNAKVLQINWMMSKWILNFNSKLRHCFYQIGIHTNLIRMISSTLRWRQMWLPRFLQARWPRCVLRLWKRLDIWSNRHFSRVYR